MEFGRSQFAVRQLVEVAVRALSPGINDPPTAMSVITGSAPLSARLFRCTCQPAFRWRDDRPVLAVPSIQYDGLSAPCFI